MLGVSCTKGRFAMKRSEITSMSVAEKLQAIEALWDALEDDDIESPKWHNDMLDERIHLLESCQAEFVSLEELKQQKL